VQATNTNVINSAFNLSSPQPEWQGQLNETHTFSARSVNQFIAAFQWSGILFGPADPAAALAVFPSQLNFTGNSFTELGENQAHPVGRHITQYQLVDNYSYTFGKHTLKAGVDFLRDDLNVFFYGTNTAGTITDDLANFYNGGVVNYTQSFPTTLHSPFAAYDLGFYIEDDWTLTPHLKLTGTLRFDRESNITSRQNAFARLAEPFKLADHDPTIPRSLTIRRFKPASRRHFIRLRLLLLNLAWVLPGRRSGAPRRWCAAASATSVIFCRSKCCRASR
jgi:outer membrane receptor protein involved in Fe transport